MAWKLISVTAVAAAAFLAALGPVGAQTSGSSTQTQESQSDSGSAATGGGAPHPDTSASRPVRIPGSASMESPSASPPTMDSDKEAAKARGVDPDKKPGDAVQEKVQEK